MVALLKDAMYGNCPLDAGEPPTILDQSADPSNLISFERKIGFSAGPGSAVKTYKTDGLLDVLKFCR